MVVLDDVQRVDALVGLEVRRPDAFKDGGQRLEMPLRPPKRRVVDEQLVPVVDPLEFVDPASIADDEAGVGCHRLQQLKAVVNLGSAEVRENRGDRAHSGLQRSTWRWRKVILFILSKSTRTSADSAPSSLSRPRQMNGMPLNNS